MPSGHIQSDEQACQVIGYVICLMFNLGITIKTIVIINDCQWLSQGDSINTTELGGLCQQ